MDQGPICEKEALSQCRLREAENKPKDSLPGEAFSKNFPPSFPEKDVREPRMDTNKHEFCRASAAADAEGFGQATDVTDGTFELRHSAFAIFPAFPRATAIAAARTTQHKQNVMDGHGNGPPRQQSKTNN